MGLVKKTEFSEFAVTLATYCQGDRSPEQFTKDMFESIYGSNDVNALVSDMELRTFKGYYYAEHDITTIAKKISGDLNLGNFAEKIVVPSDDSKISLCEDFREWCPEIDECTFGMEIAERFQKIIIKAAGSRRKKKSVTEEKPVTTPAEEKTPKEKYGAALVSEVMSTCPCAGCTRQLYIRKNGQILPNYEVVIIDPSIPGVYEDNLIAMCPEHAKAYVENSTKNRISQMRAIKGKFRELSDLQDITSEEKLDEDIIRVLSKIPNLPSPMNIDLNYTPVALKQKIEDDNNELLARIKIWVNLHYPDVHEALQALNKNGKLKFDPFCKQVRANYLRLKAEEYPQDKIYDGMIEWLVKATNEDRHLCEVIIAYFVQKCEVFDAITK